MCYYNISAFAFYFVSLVAIKCNAVKEIIISIIICIVYFMTILVYRDTKCKIFNTV